MPLDIDERWEYWTADPEIEELLAEEAEICPYQAMVADHDKGSRFEHLGNCKPCQKCGSMFVPRRERNKFCSRWCFFEAQKKNLFGTGCPCCGGLVPPSKTKPRIFCSRACKHRATVRKYCRSHTRERKEKRTKITNLKVKIAQANESKVP